MTTLDMPSPRLTSLLLRITAAQYHDMMEKGIISEGSPTELLDGMIVLKDRSDMPENPMGHGPKHRLALRLLTRLAARIDSERRHFQLQLPIHLSEYDEPEPDGAIILGPDRQFENHLPTAQDVACVLEVAHSSLERDAADKLAKYAQAGIPQYLIVNLRDSRVEIYEEPGPRSYRRRTLADGTDVVQLQLGLGEVLAVPAADLLP
jgi:Uma2 family endonuclease